MSETAYQGGTIITALGLIGLALAGGMFFVIVFPAKPRAPPGVAITMPNGVSLDTTLNFRPPFISVRVGDTVTWTNKDDAPHTTTAVSWPKSAVKWDSGELDNADSFGVPFNIVGTYTYHCFFHPGWMQGTINVTST
jgi:plastocyanin